MTQLAVAMIVTDAKRVAASAALSAIAGGGIGFLRACCAASEPSPTWETPATHWYNNFTALDQALVVAWQDAVAEAGAEDDLFGLIIFTSINAQNAVAWAATNLASQGLMFVPDEE